MSLKREKERSGRFEADFDGLAKVNDTTNTEVPAIVDTNPIWDSMTDAELARDPERIVQWRHHDR